MNQDRLASLLILITGPSALSLLELHTEKNETGQYLELKNAFNKTTITTFSTLYRKVFECKLSNHKSLKKYGEEVATARNKLKELGQPMDDLEVTCAFLNGLDSFYQAWKDMYLGAYAKNPTKVVEGTETMIVSTIEEVIQLLIDRQTNTLQSSTKGDSTRAFGAVGKARRGSPRPAYSEKRPRDSRQRDQKCETCLSINHSANNCWYTHPEKRNDRFKQAHPNAAAVQKALEETKKTNKEWHKSHPKKTLIAKARLSVTGIKNDTWYLDSAASIHTTHHLTDYITPDLDDSKEAIEIANGEILYTQGAETIAIEVLVNGVCDFIHLHNVHYCPEVDSNLLSLGALTAKGFEFLTKNGTLHVMDSVGDIVLQSKCEGQVFPLFQPKGLDNFGKPGALEHAYSTIKPQSMELWHQRTGHANKPDLIRLQDMAKGIIIKNSKSPFCGSCAFGKQHRVHSKEPPTHRAKLPGERFHNDLFGGGNTLPGVGGY